jgi:hypothetical protein
MDGVRTTSRLWADVPDDYVGQPDAGCLLFVTRRRTTSVGAPDYCHKKESGHATQESAFTIWRWAIPAFEELCARGCFGPLCLRLTKRLMREESWRFPVLSSAGRLQQADQDDLVGKFVVDRIVPVTAMLLAQAVDDDSMGRLLRISIKHWLIDQARQTAVGALRRRLEELLSGVEALEQVPDGKPGAGRWRLTGSAGLPWSGRTGDLIDAARTVAQVKMPKWSSTTRRPPVADRASLVAVAHAVLSTAGGSVELAQLVEVFVARFPAVLDPALVPLPDGSDDRSDGIVDTALAPEEQVIAELDELDASTSAAEIVGMLTGSERRMVPLLDDMQAVQDLLGCRRSQAYHQAKRLKEKLVQLCGDREGHLDVGKEVIRLCGEADMVE